jgi:hypothetical protein
MIDNEEVHSFISSAFRSFGFGCLRGESEPPALPLAEVDLVATDIAYDKDRIEVMVGQPLKINLQNEGALEHDFSIMEVPHTGEVHAEEMLLLYCLRP